MRFASLFAIVTLFTLHAAAAPTEPPVEGEVYPCANANKVRTCALLDTPAVDPFASPKEESAASWSPTKHASFN
ncbi:hypothetical protein NMY22_g3440 [Coprinellus aureogranulatus]|nr:hypothetical protein NMY22_g3440 [Coprinellus aureogranulatus]